MPTFARWTPLQQYKCVSDQSCVILQAVLLLYLRYLQHNVRNALAMHSCSISPTKKKQDTTKSPTWGRGRLLGYEKLEQNGNIGVAKQQPGEGARVLPFTVSGEFCITTHHLQQHRHLQQCMPQILPSTCHASNIRLEHGVSQGGRHFLHLVQGLALAAVGLAERSCHCYINPT
jgi:hypothetical protein